jgi:hypothetical protein
MRCIVHICRATATDHSGYLLRLQGQSVGSGRVELLQDRQALFARITALGLPASRLTMTLSNLRDEDQAVWVNCEVHDPDFAEFGRQTRRAENTDR